MSAIKKKKKLCSALIMTELIAINEETLILESISEETKERNTHFAISQRTAG
jgi:hypothetical protein